MHYRLTGLLVLFATSIFPQAVTPEPAPAGDVAAVAGATLAPDMTDSGVVRAQSNLEKVKELVEGGALPRVRLKKAQEELEDALDMSVLRQSLYTKDLTSEQTDQMIAVAERMVYRRQKTLADTQAMVASGILSRAEAEGTAADLERAQKELEWAQTRARLVAQLAESMRIQQSIASIEMQVEQHPDWIGSAGSVAEKYSGNGMFTPADLQKVEMAYLMKFSKPLPLSANGETALHRSLGFDHRGRVDVAVNPDQTEGRWLRQYLMTNKIPYFAFRAAVAHRATGAHIHIGPQSTRIAASLAPSGK